jgi:hypothetical protein
MPAARTAAPAASSGTAQPPPLSLLARASALGDSSGGGLTEPDGTGDGSTRGTCGGLGGAGAPLPNPGAGRAAGGLLTSGGVPLCCRGCAHEPPAHGSWLGGTVWHSAGPQGSPWTGSHGPLHGSPPACCWHGSGPQGPSPGGGGRQVGGHSAPEAGGAEPAGPIPGTTSRVAIARTTTTLRAAIPRAGFLTPLAYPRRMGRRPTAGVGIAISPS